MCVIFFAYQKHPQFPLILLANRDEFYNRPTAKAQYWEDFPDILGGRDLVSGGTWLGVNKNGRFAAVTNFRDLNGIIGEDSRGDLTADFLKSSETAEKYVQKVKNQSKKYSGFNLIVGEINQNRNEIFYYSNRSNEILQLQTGIYGLSNSLLDTPWVKVQKGKVFLAENLNKNLSNEDYFRFLADETLANDEDLPNTGVGFEREKILSAVFIKSPNYGTRCSTILTFNRSLEIELEEKIYV